MFLSPSQIAELTTRRTKPAQRRQLDALGVKYGLRTACPWAKINSLCTKHLR